MKMRCLLLALLCASVLAIPLLAQTPTQTATAPVSYDSRIPAIIHSLEQVKYVRETQLSPDGSQIAWTVGREGIFVAPLSDPATAQHVTACTNGANGGEGGIAWSPDSKTLAFFSDCTPDHKAAIFTDEIGAAAAPHMLVQLDGYAKNLTYSPDGKYLTFLYVKGATRPSGALAAMPLPSGVIGVEHIEVQRVAAVNAQSGTLTQVTPANLHVYEFDWSPDSKKLAYVAAAPPGEDNWWTAKLYVQDFDWGFNPTANSVVPPHIVFNPTTTNGTLHGLQIAVPRWSPDGKKIAFIGGLMSDQGVTGGDIYVIPSTGGEAMDITPDVDRTASWIHWLGGSKLLVTWIKDGDVELGEINPTTGETLANYGAIAGNVENGRLLLGVSISADGKVAYVKSSFESAPEVYAGELGRPVTQITHLNDALKPSWGKAESVMWTNEGFHVQGWLLYPANYDPAKKYPLIVYVHGGPAWANMPGWPYPGYGPVPFSALGYFVLETNPRGSYGEGERFSKANRKDFGYGDLRDILAGVDTVIKSHNIDPDRVGITGWSYGGFMTMFAVTQTHRFKAAVAGAGISDWLSYYGENSIDEWMIPFFGASVYDDPAVYAKSSAINYIKNVKTPTLVVVGDRDGECPAPQSFEFWHALRYEHVPTELVVYPDEGHGFSKPVDRINVLERALGWFGQYMP